MPEPARAALLDGRLPPQPEPDRLAAYSDADWQAIMTAIRRDVRVARDRIRHGRALLDRYRAGAMPAGHEAELGHMLDQFDRTADLPRVPSGDFTQAVYRVGGIRRISQQLCLSAREVTAFCLLLTALTGENFGTVVAWPAIHYRPDGTHDEAGVALLEETKPRRGPDREHMIAALEDLPAGLAEVLDEVDGDRRLFRSPLRVYRLLVDLTELTRRHGGLTGAATFYSPNNNGRQPKKVCRQGVTTPDVAVWARSHGFPPASAATAETKPGIDVRRVRQTAIEQRRHPVAHTRQTMNDVYLKRSRTVQADSRQVVAAALREQVGKARTRQGIAVFTAEFLLHAERDPASAAAEAGLDSSTLRSLLAGHQDTAVAGCTDNRSSPHAEPGEPCPASFLACLDCENARAMPRHLPIQVTVRDRIGALRPNLDAALWRHRYEQPLNRLDDLLSHYTPAERDQARREISPAQARLVDDLMNGRLDLR